ncbi:MAG: hypothetical protein HMLIMOIP_002601, partial [Candidatus Nitrosomirales archaeon]
MTIRGKTHLAPHDPDIETAGSKNHKKKSNPAVMPRHSAFLGPAVVASQTVSLTALESVTL